MNEENKEVVEVQPQEQEVASEDNALSNNEAKTESIDKLIDKTTLIEKEKPEDRPYDEVIEEERLKINDAYKKSRRLSNILMLITVAFLVGFFILIIQKNSVLNIIGYVGVGVTFVAMIVFYILNKNKLPNKIKDYVKVVTEVINRHVFNDGQYKETKSDVNDRLESQDVMPDGVYENANSITSRNVVEGLFEGRHFRMGDLALRKGVNQRRLENLFIGKYYSYPNNKHFEGRYVLMARNKENPIDAPNAINDLVVLEESEEFVIYGPKEDARYKNDLSSKFIEAIKDIKIGGDLLNLVVVIWAGHSAAYLSYSDAIIALPFEKEFKKEPFEQLTHQQLQLLNALSILLK